jgi:hypothetical protein
LSGWLRKAQKSRKEKQLWHYFSLRPEISVKDYSAAFLAAALRGGAFLAVTSFSVSLAAAFLAGLAAFSALGAAAFLATVCGLELPYEPLNLFPFAVRLSPLPMIILLFVIE